MIPVVTPDEMKSIDNAASEAVEILVARAGWAVAHAAIEMLGGAYGRRVVIVEGKGNNGADGRHAARRLRSRGVKVIEIEIGVEIGVDVPACDLLIDAAFGTGFHGEWTAPRPAPGTPVLAVDIPSGVDGLTGETNGRPLTADQTVTFGALKPGLILYPGAEIAGKVRVADIGLDVSSARIHLVEASDIARWYPRRDSNAHKWLSAVWVIGGSDGLEGAAALTTSAALRCGAGYVRWSSPGSSPVLGKPTEAVATSLPRHGWAAAVLEEAERFKVIAIGNGLGLAAPGDIGRDDLFEVVRSSPVPVVVDADALTVLGGDAGSVTSPTTILTPHDGEYARLMGTVPGPDRVKAARDAAEWLGAVVLLKGPATVVADPDGRVLVSNSGDSRLASLGTGDVLSGVISAFVARGAAPFEAAAAGAYVHGLAGGLGLRNGLIASDVVSLLPIALDHLCSPDVDQ